MPSPCSGSGRSGCHPGRRVWRPFADFRDWKSGHPDEALAYQSKFPEGAALKFLKDPKTSKEVRNLAFCVLRPRGIPDPPDASGVDDALTRWGAERDQIVEIATLLAALVSGWQLRLPCSMERATCR